MVVSHPDAPVKVGGRPPAPLKISLKEEKLLKRLDELAANEEKHENAVNDLIEEEEVSRATIFRAIEKRKKLDQQNARAKSAFAESKKEKENRNLALSKLTPLSDKKWNLHMFHATQQCW